MQEPQDIETIGSDDREWMTAPEVAELLHMTTAWVYTQTRAMVIPHVPLGRYVRYRRSALETWLADAERRPPGPAGKPATAAFRVGGKAGETCGTLTQSGTAGAR